MTNVIKGLVSKLSRKLVKNMVRGNLTNSKNLLWVKLHNIAKSCMSLTIKQENNTTMAKNEHVCDSRKKTVEIKKMRQGLHGAWTYVLYM